MNVFTRYPLYNNGCVCVCVAACQEYLDIYEALTDSPFPVVVCASVRVWRL